MRYQNVYIESMGQYLPETSTTSLYLEDQLKDLYDRLKIHPGRIELMTGIWERRLWPSSTRPSDLAFKAIQDIYDEDANNDASVDLSQVDLLIHASVCRDFLEPATATVVADKLKLKNGAQCFDLSNACLGAIQATCLAASLIESGQIKNALIVTGENAGPLVESTLQLLKTNSQIDRRELKKYFANLTLGSGATALYLVAEKMAKNPWAKLEASFFMNDVSSNHLCRGDGNIHQLSMQTDSEKLLEMGLLLGKQSLPPFFKIWERDQKNIDVVLTHQVGKAHEELSLKTFELNSLITHRTYPFLGNTGSSALPLTMIDAYQKNVLKQNQSVLLLGIGSGLVNQNVGLKWLRNAP